MSRYQVKLQKNARGANGSTRYAYSTKLKATIFAAGYQAALWDLGRTDLYVSVWDNGGGSAYNHKHEKIVDSESLKGISEREY